jgi:hypothetical protein
LQHILPHHDVLARLLDYAQRAEIDGGREAFKQASQ